MSESVIEITDANFKEKVIQPESAFFLDFYTTWCAPCKAFIPLLEEIASDPIYKKNITFGKINAEENDDVVSNANLLSVPTFIIYNYGKEIARKQGYKSKEDVESFIADHILLKKKH